MTESRSPLTEEMLAEMLRDAEREHALYEAKLGHRDEDWQLWYARHMLPRIQNLR